MLQTKDTTTKCSKDKNKMQRLLGTRDANAKDIERFCLALRDSTNGDYGVWGEMMVPIGCRVRNKESNDCAGDSNAPKRDRTRTPIKAGT